MMQQILQDPEQKELDLKISKAIQSMPNEVKDRFKALKVIQVNYSTYFMSFAMRLIFTIQDQGNAIDDEEDQEYRELEVKYDKLYQEIYELRRKVVMGEGSSVDQYLQDYDKRAKELDDDQYKNIEVNPVDVKDI